MAEVFAEVFTGEADIVGDDVQLQRMETDCKFLRILDYSKLKPSSLTYTNTVRLSRNIIRFN